MVWVSKIVEELGKPIVNLIFGQMFPGEKGENWFVQAKNVFLLNH